MIKETLVAALCSLMVTAKNSCTSKKQACFKARLEIKAICSNYTIKVLEGAIDSALVNTSWTDESTGKAYTDVFGLGNPCIFPADIKEGDEFYFTIEEEPGKQDCAVCMAYYPTPDKKLAIKVQQKGCPNF